ncbi:MAG: HEAT repeat domain-containing protein, partial [Planctomycetota bacterium]
MPARPALLLCGLGAAGVVGALLWVGRDGADEGRARRPALELPRPSAEERSAYFLEMVLAGEETDLGKRRPATGRLIGEQGLRRLGAAAAAYLLDEARRPRFRRNPALLDSVFNLLPQIPGALDHPGLYPFLLYWLDPAHVPEPSPRSDWGARFRKHIFSLFTHRIDRRAVPYCVEELERTERVHDLRAEAITVLLSLGREDVYAAHYASLPPNEAEPQNPLRVLTLDRVREMAGLDAAPELRASAHRLEPLLRRALQSALSAERIRAAAALLALGDESMAERLVGEFESERETNLEMAWLALELLARQRRDPYCRRVFLAQIDEPREAELRTRTFQASVHLLGLRWPDDEVVTAALWRRFEELDPPEAHLAVALVSLDRPRVAARLLRAVRTGAGPERFAALDIARRLHLREVNGLLLEQARRESDPTLRARYFGNLAALRAYESVPMLVAVLQSEGEPDAVRGVAAQCLLDLGERPGVDAVARALRELDPRAREAVVGRAAAGGGAVIPASLAPAL